MTAWNLSDMVDRVLLFVSQSAGVTLPRIVVSLAGLTIVVLVVMGRWERRTRIAPTLAGLLFGGALLAISIDTSILHAVAQSSFISRIRVLLGLLSLLVMAVTFESIRIARLRERYALLWMATGAMVLLAALFPNAIRFVTLVLGVQYLTAVVAVVFTFLLLVVFHFSIALSSLDEDRARIAQRTALIDLRVTEVERKLGLAPAVALAPPQAARSEGEMALPPVLPPGRDRAMRGAAAASLAVIGIAVLSVVVVGLRTGQPLIGDEVTHYFMLKRQAAMLPTPNYVAEIPNAWSDAHEIRNYPHPNGWHYLGAVVARMARGRFWAVQVYHALFWFQLLAVCYLWARHRRGNAAHAPVLLTIVVASVPMNLLFSVSFYQDIPMAAQAVTAFYLLDRRKYVRSALFLALATWMKVTGVVFAAPFLAVAAVGCLGDLRRAEGGLRSRALPFLRLGALSAILGLALWGNGWMLKSYAGASYYPAKQFGRLVKAAREPQASNPVPLRNEPIPDDGAAAQTTDTVRPVTPYEAEIIANHPGDLRIPANFLIYGGVLMWMVALGGAMGLLRPRGDRMDAALSRKRAWPLLVGGFYIAVTAWQLRTTPDARFFLPGLPFVLLPLCEWTMRLPKTRWILAGAMALGLMQGAYVLDKASDLRSVSRELQESIAFLERNPPVPARVFMYPEGNYRLFPVQHEWYLGYRLREFWRGSNDERIAMCRRFGVGAIVIKKRLVKSVDERITDLGVYPDYFVRDLADDPRFEKTFENKEVIVYLVPRPDEEHPR